MDMNEVLKKAEKCREETHQASCGDCFFYKRAPSCAYNDDGPQGAGVPAGNGDAGEAGGQ